MKNKKTMILKSLMMSGLWLNVSFGDLGSSQNALVKDGSNQKNDAQSSLAVNGSSIKNAAAQDGSASSKQSWGDWAKAKWNDAKEKADDGLWNKKDGASSVKNTSVAQNYTPEQIKEIKEMHELLSLRDLFEDGKKIVTPLLDYSQFDVNNYEVFTGLENPLLTILQNVYDRMQKRKPFYVYDFKKINKQIIDVAEKNKQQLQEKIAKLDKEIAGMSQQTDIIKKNNKEFEKKYLELLLKREVEIANAQYATLLGNIVSTISRLSLGINRPSFSELRKFQKDNFIFSTKKNLEAHTIQKAFYRDLLSIIESYGANISPDISDTFKKRIENELNAFENKFEESVKMTNKGQNMALLGSIIDWSLVALFSYWIGGFLYNQYAVNQMVDEIDMYLKEMEKEIRITEERANSGKTVVHNKSGILTQCNELKAVIKDIRSNFTQLKDGSAGMWRRIWVRRSLGKLLSKFESTMKNISKEFNK